MCEHEWRLASEECLFSLPGDFLDPRAVPKPSGWRRRWYCIRCRVFETRDEPLDAYEQEREREHSCRV